MPLVSHWENRDRVARQCPRRFLPRWQKVRQSRSATQPRGTDDVPDWVPTLLCKPTFWDSESFNFKCHGRQLVAPTMCNPWRRVGLGRCRATRPWALVFRCRVLVRGTLGNVDHGWPSAQGLSVVGNLNLVTYSSSGSRTAIFLEPGCSNHAFVNPTCLSMSIGPLTRRFVRAPSMTSQPAA